MTQDETPEVSVKWTAKATVRSGTLVAVLIVGRVTIALPALQIMSQLGGAHGKRATIVGTAGRRRGEDEEEATIRLETGSGKTARIVAAAAAKDPRAVALATKRWEGKSVEERLAVGKRLVAARQRARARKRKRGEPRETT